MCAIPVFAFSKSMIVHALATLNSFIAPRIRGRRPLRISQVDVRNILDRNIFQKVKFRQRIYGKVLRCVYCTKIYVGLNNTRLCPANLARVIEFALAKGSSWIYNSNVLVLYETIRATGKRRIRVQHDLFAQCKASRGRLRLLALRRKEMTVPALRPQDRSTSACTSRYWRTAACPSHPTRS